MNEVYRSVRVPVNRTSTDWQEFCNIVMSQFREMTRMANASIQLLFKHDFSPIDVGVMWSEQSRVAVSPKIRGKKKKRSKRVFAYPGKINLYEEIRKMCPSLDTQVIGTATRRIRGDYEKKRRGFLIYMNERLPFYQFPFPILVASKDYSIVQTQENVKGKLVDGLAVKVKLYRTDAGPKWVTLHLDNGIGHLYQRSAIVNMLKEKRKHGGLQIELKSANQGDHRPTIVLRDKNRNRKHHRVQLSIAVPFMRRSNGERAEKILILHTSSDHFLVGRTARSVVWKLNEDRVAHRVGYLNAVAAKGTVNEHDRRRQRLSQDIKFDRRAGVRSGVREALRSVSEHHRNWVNSWLNETVARVMDYVERNHVSCVFYNDDARDFVDHFNWSGLKSKLTNACDLADVEFGDCEVKPDMTEDDWQRAITVAKAKITKKKNDELAAEKARRSQVLAGAG